MPQPGQILPIQLTLDDGEETKYPLAYVYDDTLSQITGSPFELSHIVGGMYGINTVEFPDETDFILVRYRIFDDAGHTISTWKYPINPRPDYWTIDNPQPEVIAKLDIILGILNALQGEDAGFELRGIISNDTLLIGKLTNDQISLKGTIEDDDAVLGLIEEEEFIGLVRTDTDTELVGKIECGV